jgi:Homeodomain-like domain
LFAAYPRFKVVVNDVYFWAPPKRRYRLREKGVFSPDELLSALKRYLKESGDTEQAVARQIGVNHHTLQRWLSDKQSPKKGPLGLTALFLRRAGYL